MHASSFHVHILCILVASVVALVVVLLLYRKETLLLLRVRNESALDITRAHDKRLLPRLGSDLPLRVKKELTLLLVRLQLLLLEQKHLLLLLLLLLLSLLLLEYCTGKLLLRRGMGSGVHRRLRGLGR